MTQPIALDDQVCFALSSAARATQAAYRPLLAELDLTYPQWLVLIALWERDGATVSELGRRLHLDSGTLSPLLRRMEERGLLRRERTAADGRQVDVHLTDAGRNLRHRAPEVQECLARAVTLTPDELFTLRDLARRLVAPLDHTPEGASA